MIPGYCSYRMIWEEGYHFSIQIINEIGFVFVSMSVSIADAGTVAAASEILFELNKYDANIQC